jgi:hypothetical protein
MQDTLEVNNMESPEINLFPMPGSFDVTETLYDIYTTANMAKINEKHNVNEKLQLDKPALEIDQRNVFLNSLLEELASKPRRTIFDFADAVERTMESLEEKYPKLVKNKDIKGFDDAWSKAMKTLKKMKDNGLGIVFKNIYPIRLMLCWLDALDVVIGAYIVMKQSSISPQNQRSKWIKPEDYWNSIYEVAMAAGILLTRIAEQTRGYIINTKLPEEEQTPEGDLIDSYVDMLARDMAYMTRIQGENHLLETTTTTDVTKFQDFLLKQYA